MKVKRLPIIVGSTILILMITLLPFISAYAKPAKVTPKFHWKFACAFPATDVGYFVRTVKQAKAIEKASGGLIKVDTYPAGVLVSEEEQLSTVTMGGIEMGNNLCAAQNSVAPMLWYFRNAPGSFRTMDETYECTYKWGLYELSHKAFAKAGLHLLGACTDASIGLFTNFPIDSFNDMKGHKMFALPVVVDVFKAIGAVPTMVPGWDIYTAMKLGTVDAYNWTYGELETGGFKEVTKYVVIYPHIFQTASDVYVNMKAWQALGPELQEKVQKGFDEANYQIGAEDAAYDEAGIEAAKKYGVQIVTFPEEEALKYDKLARSFWAKKAEASPSATKAMEIVINFLKSKGR